MGILKCTIVGISINIVRTVAVEYYLALIITQTCQECKFDKSK